MKWKLKNILMGCSLGIIIFLLAGCGKGSLEISYEAQYLKTPSVLEDVEYPVIKKITSVAELNQYYKDNVDNYDFFDNTGVDVPFATAIDEYDDNYFEQSFLLLMVLEEKNSSIYHEIQKIDEDGNILIEKNITDKDSTNTTHWHVLIELDKQYQDTEFKIEFDEVVTETDGE